MILSRAPRERKPPRTIVLPPSAFATDWSKRPSTDAAIGLRLLSQRDLDVARREAEREAQGFYDEFRQRRLDVTGETVDDVFNDAFLVQVAARATCDPNDASKPYFPFAEDVVAQALTSEALRRIWDELVILHKGSIAARPSADDALVRALGATLRRRPDALDEEGRRLCAYLAEKLGITSAHEGAEDVDYEDETQGGYYAVGGP